MHLSRGAGKVSTMVDKKTALKTAQEILAASPFKETEVALTFSHAMLTRYGDNAVTQNVEQTGITLGLRAVLHDPEGAKTARVECDQTDTHSVKRAYERLKKILEVMPSSSDIAGIYKPQDNPRAAEKPEPTLPNPEDAALAVAKASEAAKPHGLQASGTMSAEIQTTVLVNSQGLEAVDLLSDSEFACTIEGNGGAGRGFSHEPYSKHLSIDASIERALNKCLDSSGRLGEAVALEPGNYDVVLEPAAIAELLVYFGWTGLSAKAYLENRVFCRQKLGQKIISENISLLDDPHDPRVSGASFDGFGVPKRKLTFVDHGVLTELASDAKTATKIKRAPTGHGNTEPNASDSVPWNLSLQWHGPTASNAELISRVKRGVLVTQFHYTNTVDVMVPSFTGMTRNGTFLIENGRVTRPILNMRFTQSMIDVFNHIEAASSNSERVTTFFGGASLCPTVLVRNFHFSSGTGF